MLYGILIVFRVEVLGNAYISISHFSVLDYHNIW